MRIAIYDSCIHHVKRLETIIEKIIFSYPVEYQIEGYTNSAQAANAEKPADIGIIAVHGQEEIWLACHMKQQNEQIEIIFLAESYSFVNEAFALHAFQYLVKPLVEEQFKQTFCAAVKNLMKRSNGSIAFMYKGCIHHVFLEKVSCFEYRERKICVHTADGDQIFYRGHLQDMEKRAAGFPFLRVHSAFLVNLDYVQKLQRFEAILGHGEHVPVSVNKFPAVKECFREYLEKSGLSDWNIEISSKRAGAVHDRAGLLKLGK